MKLFTKIACVFLLPLLAIAESGSGGSVDNGGEYLALKFTRIGQEALSAMKKLSPAEAILSAAELQRMEIAIMQTRVNGVAGPILDNSGREVDARFLKIEGKPVVEIDETHWPAIFADLETSYRLVAHEYFRAMGLNDDNYKISARLGEGTAREILRGRIVVNAGAIGGQSKFEQLGDYFRNADIADVKDFSSSRIGICYDEKGQAYRNLSIDPHKRDNGPLIDPSYHVVFVDRGTVGHAFNTDQLSAWESSLYLFNQGYGPVRADSWLFRKRGKNLFVEAMTSHEDLRTKNGKSGINKIRCYFWEK